MNRASDSRQGYCPTRIIDVGLIRQEILHPLVRKDSYAKGLDYATLSHCWGDIVPLKLTQSPFSTLKGGVPVSQLPKTFADAVIIARHLKIRYLWVDPLCIFEDSDDDWKYESSQMHEVYSNGVLNIAASGAPNSSQGFFSERNPSTLTPCKVTVKLPDKPSLDYFMQSEESVKWQLEEMSVLHRGWVMQERLLAPRIVYFGKQEIFWQCS